MGRARKAEIRKAEIEDEDEDEDEDEKRSKEHLTFVRLLASWRFKSLFPGRKMRFSV